MERLIITAAITGAETAVEAQPNLPITPKQQGIAARECVEAGASIIHLHVRDERGRPSQRISDFENAISEIKSQCDPVPIIQISTGGAVGVPIEERVLPIIKLRPEMASLNVATMNFGEDIFVNKPADVSELAKRMSDLKVVPEVEVYDAGHVEIAKRLLKKGFLKKPIHYQFVLGVDGGMSGEIKNLDFLLGYLDDGDTWSVAGVGRYETPLAFEAVKRGGFVRVGFEDNIFFEKGILAKSNAELVERVTSFAKGIGRKVATPNDARKMLGVVN